MENEVFWLQEGKGGREGTEEEEGGADGVLSRLDGGSGAACVGCDSWEGGWHSRGL